MSAVRFPVVCAGCPCLCDDIAIALADGRFAGTENACPQGNTFLASLPHGPVRSWMRGKEVPLEAALKEAAHRLASAAMPTVMGLSESSVEALRQAVALTQTMRGIIAPWPCDPTRAWGQQTPDLGRTWAEIKHCDLLIFWRTDPVRFQPRFFDRLPVDGTRPRIALVANRDSENWSHVNADTVLIVPATGDLAALRQLRLHLEKQEPLGRHAVKLAELLCAAKRCHVFLGSVSALDDLLTGQWQLLAAHLVNKVRISISPFAENMTVKAATEVLTWLTGYPGPVSFATGQPTYRPGLWEADRLLTSGMTDVALCLGPCPVGQAARIWIDRQEHPDAEVSFLVPGLSPLLDAHVMRADGIPLRLAGTSDAEADPVVSLLSRLRQAVKEAAG